MFLRIVPVTRAARRWAWGALFTATPMALHAQSGTVQAPSQIVTTAMGEATVIPDRGEILFAVEKRASTAAVAGAENARLQSAVIAALKAKGVLAEQITTSGYSLGPDEQFTNGQRKVTGYIARNSVIVRVEKIDQVGALIDAALGAGANSIGGLRYYSTKFESVRRSALEMAVAKARGDAEVMAKAAGGTLGAPLEITANDMGQPRPMYDVALSARVMSASPETPIAVGEQKVTVSVTSRWIFVVNR